MRNYSGYGFIGLIEDNAINVLATGRNLDVAVAPNSTSPPVFFERLTNRFLQLDVVNQAVMVIPITIKKGNYLIMSALANDSDLVVLLHEESKERLLYHIPIDKLGSVVLE